MIAVLCAVLATNPQPKKEVKVMSINSAVETSRNRSVFIDTRGANGLSNGHGTGVWVADNLVLTNFHVLTINSATFVEDKLAKVVRVDTLNDLALLSVEIGKIAPLNIAEGVSIGEFVYFVGNPHDHRKAVFTGRIVDVTEPYIYADAHPMPGCSGSGLYNQKGELIGLISSMEGDEVHGFTVSMAVPANIIITFLTNK